MRLKVIALCVLSFLCLFSARAQTLNTEKSSVTINEKNAELQLVFENSKKSFESQITLELLDKLNNVSAKTSENLRIKKGLKSYDFSLPLGNMLENHEDEIIWYRLRYSVGDKTEIVSLSELVRNNFELRVIATENIVAGMNYRSRVLAINPIDKTPVKDVRITASLTVEIEDEEEDELTFKSKGKTNKDGFAILDFQIPTSANLDRDSDLKVVGRKDGLRRQAIEDIANVTDDFSFLMLTDKPIYQAEQELKIRGILLKGTEGKTVVTDAELEFNIKDGENTLLYKETVKTSDFGVASIVWEIPENAKLGDYKINVKTLEGDNVGYQKVKISRYDLPNFTVKPKPDKTFYLPEKNEAEIEVKADYLFGKPVTKSKVRIVEEKSRQWNWKKQKYDIDEGQVREGESDADGKFTAKIDLKKFHEDIEDNDWRKFQDISLTAYVTDLTSNKTEQRRFDIRVTKEPIHVYYIGNRDEINSNTPVTAYVSTFYADGSPAVCDVEFEGREDDKSKKFRTIKKIKTNSFGAGKLEFKRPKFIEEDDYMDIKITARDSKGKVGIYGGEKDDKEIDFDDDEETLKLETKKAIHKPGESIKVEVNSAVKNQLVYIDVIKGWSVIDSYNLKLKKGKAKLKVPYQEMFQGELKIAAYFEDEDEDVIRKAIGVIYPSPQNLQINADFDKKSYKPAEEATVNFSVLDKVGNAIESVLGVVVFDKAVEERARTDAEFGGMSSGFSGWLGYGKSFGNVNIKDLNDLDLTKPISDELQLVAEVMLYDSYYYPKIFRSENYETDAKSVYVEYFKKQFNPIDKALKETYAKQNYKHPIDDDSLENILGEKGLNLVNLRDPWEQKYKAIFDVKKTQNILTIKTSGADKKFDTKDDFTVLTTSFNYITPLGLKINEAINKYHKRTGKFIRDEKTLLSELGVTELKDRFGRPYRMFFGVYRRYYLTRLRSIGNDGVYDSRNWRGDDFDVWTYRIGYFKKTEEKIRKVLQKLKTFPTDTKEFVKFLSEKDIDLTKIKDGYGQSVYLTKHQFSRHTDKVEVQNVSKFGEKEIKKKTIITPVTQEVIRFTIRSRGKNGGKDNYDDFMLAQYLLVISEQTKDDEKPKIKIEKIVHQNGTGAISGTITNASGAVIPGAEVTAANEKIGFSKTGSTNDNGDYIIANLVAGNYKISVSANGFVKAVRVNVPVKANNTTNVNLSMQVGSASAMVDVSGSRVESVVNTSDATIGNTFSASQITELPTNLRAVNNLLKLQPGVTRNGYAVDGASGTENVFVIDGKKFIQDEFGKLIPFSEKSTPRLREYFPETLLWNPELVTNKDGKAEIKFKMADNITTWKLYTIASSKNGKIGVAEKEVQAFQPFFLDLEPPKFLTQGDEIYLPTQVRNYTKQNQKVDVTMAKADWFSFLNAETRTPVSVSDAQIQKIRVKKGESENAVFGFKADKFIKGGKQKVTAIAETDSDAIEKPVTVRPDGQEVVKTESKLFRRNSEFVVNFPAKAIANTPKLELKIYPNLLAHLAESVEGLLQRPYGCGEQTISSTYPNLMILKFTPKKNRMRKVAQKFLQKGYERLLGYQISNGGFSYWGGKDNADIALTAYAIRFLNDAKTAIVVDESVIKAAEDWLVSQQRSDGTWGKKYSWERATNHNRTKMLTSYIARTLAQAKTKKTQELQKALSYLKAKDEEIDEPYAMSLFGLASLELNNLDDANKIADRLSKMAITEGNGVYWKLETNTPFYGWGKAGRIETTALVLQFLTKISQKDSKLDRQDLVSKGTQFLLKNKDRYGVWYSTQTTINVLDAFLATLSDNDKKDAPKQRVAEVFVNGQKIKAFNLLPKDVLAHPITLNLSPQLDTQNNRVEIKMNDNSSIMSQIVSEHYIGWNDAKISNRNVNKSRQIKLDYKCDKLRTKIMEDVTCEVKAERIGFRGYGMLLAEIGIPPGADVSRESLEKALKNNWSFSRYDVLPDRIIVYMWSRAGGTNFKFKFKPRYGINAKTPASFVYDYYNEEAKATVAPMQFMVE